MKDGVSFVLSFLGAVVLLCLATLTLAALSGCGVPEDDQQETTSSESNVDIVDCSGAVFEGVPAEDLAAVVESAGEDAEVRVQEEQVFHQQTRTYKVSIIQGCGNTVVSEDNDVNTAVDLSSSEGSEAL